MYIKYKNSYIKHFCKYILILLDEHKNIFYRNLNQHCEEQHLFVKGVPTMKQFGIKYVHFYYLRCIEFINKAWIERIGDLNLPISYQASEFKFGLRI